MSIRVMPPTSAFLAGAWVKPARYSFAQPDNAGSLAAWAGLEDMYVRPVQAG